MNGLEHDDALERRLRTIGAEPQPPLPGSMSSYLHQLPQAHPVSSSRIARHRQVPATPPGSISIADSPRARTSGSSLQVIAGIAAALVLAVAGGLMFAVLHEAGPEVASQPAGMTVPSNELWTGLEWHDITATSDGLFATDPWSSGTTSSSVVTWPGGLAATSGDGLWISPDGRTWRLVVAGPQYVKFLGSLDGRLIAITDPVASCEETAVGPCLTTGRIWSSQNGQDWTSELLPFQGSVMSLTISSGAAVISVEAISGADPIGPRLLYVSVDGTSWRQASMPSDMSASVDLRVVPTTAGFMALGEASLTDPSSAEFWASADGLSWSNLSPAMPDRQAQISGVFQGLLGLSSPGLMGTEGLHSRDGVTWVADQDQVVSALGGMNQALSDGLRVLVVGDWNSEFFVSLGDGHWRPARSGRRHKQPARWRPGLAAAYRGSVRGRRQAVLRAGDRRFARSGNASPGADDHGAAHADAAGRPVAADQPPVGNPGAHQPADARACRIVARPVPRSFSMKRSPRSSWVCRLCFRPDAELRARRSE